MDSVSQPLNDLRTFRDSLYRCFERRADALFELTDALFELTDALLTAAGTVPSPVHLSLVPAHRRGPEEEFRNGLYDRREIPHG
jgi:hypothetical protein